MTVERVVNLAIFVIDIGTSSMRGILYDSSARQFFQQQLIHTPSYLSGGRVEQDPASWENGLLEICRVAAQASDAAGQRITAISLTAQRSSVIPLDVQGNPLAPAIMWQDKRTIAFCDTLADSDPMVFARAGSRINPVFSAGKMAWFRREAPALYAKTKTLAVIPDYILRLMTGRLCTDHTYGSRSLLMNLRERQWDDELLRLFGVEREKLCPLIAPGETAGEITGAFSVATGLRAGIPVISAGGDQQCAALGLGVIRQGDVEITAGTGAFIVAGCDQLPADLQDDVICGAAAIPGRYLLESSILTGCSALDWFQRNFYGSCEDYQTIDTEIAASPAGAHGVMLLPYFQGRATPDWNSGATASFHRISLAATRGDLARAVLEGICYEVACNLDVISRYVGEIRQTKICGGITKNLVFDQMLADICRREVCKFRNQEATALGAWMSAAVATGICGDFDSAFAIARGEDQKQVFLPREHAVYETGKEEFSQLYRQLYTR